MTQNHRLPVRERNQYTIYDDEDTRGYDYVAARPEGKKTSVVEAIAHLVKGCLGLGIMGVHSAYKKNGLWCSAILILIFGFFMAYCMYILVNSAQTLYYRLHVTSLTYSDLAEAAVATCSNEKIRSWKMCFRYYVDIIIAIDLFGSCCCYQIFIGKTIKQFVENDPNTTTAGLDGMPNLRVYIALLFFPLATLCMIRNLKYLAPFSLVANFFVLLSVGTTIYYGVKNAPALSTMPPFKTLLGLFEFSGSAIFSIGGIGVVLAIENNMKEPKHYKTVLMIGMSLVVLMVSLTGFFGYWGYGEKCLDAITLNFPLDEIFPALIKALMAIMIAITYALNFWVPFNIVWYYFKHKYPEEKHWLWERVFRMAHVILITAMGVLLPTLGNLMGFLGALCLCHMCFIFPALISLMVDWKKPGLGAFKWRLWRAVFLLIMGGFFCVSGSYTNGSKLMLFFMDLFK